MMSEVEVTGIDEAGIDSLYSPTKLSSSSVGTSISFMNSAQSLTRLLDMYSTWHQRQGNDDVFRMSIVNSFLNKFQHYIHFIRPFSLVAM